MQGIYVGMCVCVCTWTIYYSSNNLALKVSSACMYTHIQRLHNKYICSGFKYIYIHIYICIYICIYIYIHIYACIYI